MLSIFGHIIVSLLLALLITLIFILLLILVMKSNYSRSLSNINLGFIVGIGLLAVIIFFQSFLFIGACYAKKYLNAAENSMQAVVDVGKERVADADFLKAALIDEYPILERYVEDIEISEEVVNLRSITSGIHSLINGFLWRRVAWTIGALVIIGGFLFYRASKEEQRAAYLRSRMMNLYE